MFEGNTCQCGDSSPPGGANAPLSSTCGRGSGHEAKAGTQALYLDSFHGVQHLLNGISLALSPQLH